MSNVRFFKPKNYDDGAWHVVRPKKLPPIYRIGKLSRVEDLIEHFDKYRASHEMKCKILSEFLKVSKDRAARILKDWN